MLIKGILRKSVDWIEGINSTMAENLASVEQDVERRRVDKNPFEQKFRSLVRAITVPSLIIEREYGDDGVSRGHLNPYFTSQSTLVRLVLQRSCIDITECRTGYYVVSPTFLPGGKHAVHVELISLSTHSLVSLLPAQLHRDFLIRILKCFWYQLLGFISFRINYY